MIELAIYPLLLLDIVLVINYGRFLKRNLGIQEVYCENLSERLDDLEWELKA